ncbi:MAG: Asp-tRNA(Asn)/Glu-tRNA(Gln) amidotransferase subunit GatC [bacterium]|nr:Asp-tRNA(Asn)/Glu-tRNA(Gln) amidotransferase subunit GatC [bacterium]
MAEKLSMDTIQDIAILAKLELSEEEAKKAKQEMQKMLDYVEKLNELDTGSVEPMSHIFSVSNVFREDVVTGTDMRDAILSSAPHQKDGQYEVPKTIGEA